MPSAWKAHPADPPRAEALARACGTHPRTAQVLINRGAQTPAQAARFLQPGFEALTAPEAIPDLALAVDRLALAIHRREPIRLFGDSDVDGLTASVILYEALQGLGASVTAVCANRITDGYGVPSALIERWARDAQGVVVLLDCGTNQPEVARRLRTHGIDTLILDHHVPMGDPPEAFALVNPRCHSTTTANGFCSAGLAFKAAQALFQRDGREEGSERLASLLDLAALGTIADYAPLVHENRTLAALGIARLAQGKRPGLKRLYDFAEDGDITPEMVARRLIPQLNASGRLGDPSAAWRLLRADWGGDGEACLAQLQSAHATTKQLFRTTMAQAQEQVNRLHFRDQFVLVVSRAGWHPGVMGPVASQLAQQYERPAIALALDEAHGTGSGRSSQPFNLLTALEASREALVRFGGHAQACGMTVERRQIERFRELLNHYARHWATHACPEPPCDVDLELTLEEIDTGWVEELDRLAPFGTGHPRPTVLIRNVSIESHSPRTGALSQGERTLRLKGAVPVPVLGARHDVVVSPGSVKREPVLMLKAVRDAAAPSARGLTAGRTCRPEFGG